MSPNPFITIWLHPRQTVRRIVTEDPELHVLLLASLAGISEALDRASMRNIGDRLSLPIILGLACVLGPLGGLVSLWLTSYLLRWSGRWIGGVGNAGHIRTAIAWASVPVVFSLPLWIPELLLVGSDLFTKETPHVDAHPWLLIPFLVLVLAEAPNLSDCLKCCTWG